MNKQGEHGIEWTDYTLNQFTGCRNHVNGLCKGGGFPCYAYIIANRFKERYVANTNTAPRLYGIPFVEDVLTMDNPFWPRIWPERFKPLKHYPGGTKIFLDDMSDWMGPWIPDEWKIRTLEFIKAHPQYIFQTLTKQPQELPKWSPFPENCDVGVTVTRHSMFNQAASSLARIEAKVKFISFEPLLERINSDIGWYKGVYLNALLKEGWLNWLIIGACTGAKAEMSELVRKYLDLRLMPYGNRYTAQPKIEHIREIVEACQKAQIPYFLKDNLSPLLGKDLVQDMPATNTNGG